MAQGLMRRTSLSWRMMAWPEASFLGTAGAQKRLSDTRFFRFFSLSCHGGRSLSAENMLYCISFSYNRMSVNFDFQMIFVMVFHRTLW